MHNRMRDDLNEREIMPALLFLEREVFMNRSRRDSKGRTLHKGEVQRSSDKTYMYTYTDPFGKRHFVYAKDLIELREKEKQLQRDQLDGLEVYSAGRATVNEAFDRYISSKCNLKENTRANYLYTYERYVRESFGKKKLAKIKFTDVLQYYQHLMTDEQVSISTVDSVHCLLHPTFQMAVRDDIIRKNPADGVKAELHKRMNVKTGVRHALTVEQQRAFMDYVANHPVYYHWWPLFTVLLGTGMRIGECIGLRWCDLDFGKRMISVNHAIVYYQRHVDSKCVTSVSLPKTEAGIRTIPMLDMVEEAFHLIEEEQEETGRNEQVIDGMSGFIFKSRFGTVLNPQIINSTIKRIVAHYNEEEMLAAKKERRDPLILPDFSCHVFRHTFATRLCETETNLKVIQSIMGHKSIQTTMDIYADATDRKKKESFEILSEKLSDMF